MEFNFLVRKLYDAKEEAEVLKQGRTDDIMEKIKS